MDAFWIIGGVLASLLALGWWEARSHRSALNGIRIRIHVNGARGKSSVTRLIAAALREAGIRTVAKTTGTLPRLILPDGSERPIERPSRPNVIEQVGILRRARREGAEALVIECMALQPHLQALCESQFVRATHGVITNVRADHLDVMGPTVADVAKALANTTPVHGKLFTAELEHLSTLGEAAADRGSTLVVSTPDDAADVTDEEMAGFSYMEHRENVALALKVCADLGIDRATALAGMHRATCDPGAMCMNEIDFFGRRIVFANAFAANDPNSTTSAWRRAAEHAGRISRRVALVNCRSDRPERSWQLGETCHSWEGADYFLLIGSGTHVFRRAAVQHGIDPERIVEANAADVSRLFETLVELLGTSGLIVGVGNIGEHGLEIAQFFRNRTAPAIKPRRRRVRRRARAAAAAAAAARPRNGHMPRVAIAGAIGKVNGG